MSRSIRDGEPGQYEEDPKTKRPVRGVYSDMGEIEHALAAKAITLHTKIKGRAWTYDDKGERGGRRSSTPRLAA